ncbi:MAG: MerR family transcriptional regulator [Alphaproteobacteria bacterium]|nr:MerR family transcriptional regulator [Alphaproteobacteria bacterium]
MRYRIKTVAEMTGIPRNTILAWERRYGLVEPGRTPSGYRMFSDADVALLTRVKALLDQGLKISEAVAQLRQEDRPVVAAPAPSGQLQAIAPVRRRLLAHLLDLDRAGADRVRQQLVGLSFQQRLDGVYLPMLREVGRLWAEGEVSIAQEHFASAFCREQMIAMFHVLGGGPEAGALAVCAGIPGERHELGLIAVAVKLALLGFRVDYLGLEVPVGDLVRVGRARAPRVVCQSLMQDWPAERILAHARALRAGLPPGTLVAIGGPGVRGADDAAPEGVLICSSLDALLARLDGRAAVAVTA